MSKPKHILITTYWSYNSALIKTYTLPYIQLIQKNLPVNSRVYLLTLTPSSDSALTDYRAVHNEFKEKGIELINFNYQPFGLNMALKLVGMLFYLWSFIYRKKIDVIHAWCTPGGAIGYLLSKLTGKPLVLDSFEPHAETMREAGTWSENSLAYKILFRLEKLQLKKATHVICAAEGMIAYSQKTYGITKENYFVKPACVDLTLFTPEVLPATVPELRSDAIVCVYAGKFGDIYLAQEVFDFFYVANSFFGDSFKVLLLTNHSDQEIIDFCKHSNLSTNTIIKQFVKHEDVPKYMVLGHFGICPVRPVPTKKYCTPIKNGEYWAMGLPVVITANISVDSDLIAKNNIGYVLNELNTDTYLHAVKKIEELLKDPATKTTIRKVAEKYRNYTIAEDIYKTIYV